MRISLRNMGGSCVTVESLRYLEARFRHFARAAFVQHVKSVPNGVRHICFQLSHSVVTAVQRVRHPRAGYGDTYTLGITSEKSWKTRQTGNHLRIVRTARTTC